MAFVLDIPEADRIRLVEERIPNAPREQAQNLAEPIKRKHVLTATPCPYVNIDGKIDEEKLANTLVDIIKGGRRRIFFIPHGVYPNTNKWRYQRSEAVESIGRENDKQINEFLKGKFGIRNLLKEGEGRFIAEDLLPIGTDNMSCEDSMVDLARQMEIISTTVRKIVPEELDSWCTAILDFGVGATKCRAMEHFVKISVCLFSIVMRLWKLTERILPASGRELVEEIARKYSRNYVAVVLLMESMSDGGEESDG